MAQSPRPARLLISGTPARHALQLPVANDASLAIHQARSVRPCPLSRPQKSITMPIY